MKNIWLKNFIFLKFLVVIPCTKNFIFKIFYLRDWKKNTFSKILKCKNMLSYPNLFEY